MTNLSIMQRNMLATMSEDAGQLYLRGCERNEWVACKAAWAWDRLAEAGLPAMISAAARPFGGSGQGVAEFMRERLFRAYFPDGRAPVDQGWA